MTALSTGLDVFEAIERRHAVRSYLPDPVDEHAVRILLEAAVRAPTAIHEEPWSFAVIQDPRLLKRISDRAKARLASDGRIAPERLARYASPHYNVFYDAGTLIVIYGDARLGRFVAADCWLAAENLMLAACGLNLGTCVIGLAIDALNEPAAKAAIGVPGDLVAVAPIIVGKERGAPPPTPRTPPRIVAWPGRSPG